MPLPLGSVDGTTDVNANHWSIRTIAPGSAETVMAQTVALYRAAGFVPESYAVLHDATHRVTIDVASRDHSAVTSYVAVAVTDR